MQKASKLTVQENVIQQSESISASTGTDISASDLFYTMPVRRKFLKKHDTELRHITQLFHAFCLDYPHIHFKFFSDNKQVLNCPPVQRLLIDVRKCGKTYLQNTCSPWMHTHENDQVSILPVQFLIIKTFVLIELVSFYL